MDSSELDYNLPEERIARFPSRRRDACKLLAYSRRTGEIAHAKFADLPDILEKPHNFFRNSASVLKARIFAQIGKMIRPFENDEAGILQPALQRARNVNGRGGILIAPNE